MSGVTRGGGRLVTLGLHLALGRILVHLRRQSAVLTDLTSHKGTEAKVTAA